MSFVDYNRTGDTIEIVIKDYSGAKIETLKCDLTNRKRYRQILDYLKDKYGFAPEIDVDESINSIKNKEDNEVDWWGSAV